MKKIGFVIPWFYKDIPGGAEMELRGIVNHLSKKGVPVEILTTCVKEFSADWTQNYFKEGIEMIGDIPVRRFAVRKGNMKEFHKINARLMRNENITDEEEKTFLKEMVNSPDLYEYIDKHSEEYHRFVYIPYMFGTTYYGIKACPYKSILIPCLHDESYAYFRQFKKLFKDLGGIIFHAEPEYKLANSIYDLKDVKQQVLGEGIETEFDYDEKRFREKFNIQDKYIVYAGRKDSAKNINTLIQYFNEYKLRNGEKQPGLKLVLLGGGTVEIPEQIKDDVIDLGYVDKQDKYDACAGAELLCQPSKHESFSIVIMESWLCERPVLVSEDCEVTKNFVQKCNGGLYFKDYFDFEGCLNYIMENPQVAKQMGANGREFVLNNFNWDIIVQRLLDFFECKID